MKVNFVPAYRVEARKCRQRLRYWLTAVVSYAVMLGAAAVACNLLWGQADRAAAQEMKKLESHISLSDGQVTATRPQLSEASMQLQASRAVSVQPDWSVLLALLGDVRGPEVVLNRCAVFPAGAGQNGGERRTGRSKADRFRMLRGGSGANTTSTPKAAEPAKTDRVRPEAYMVEIGGLGRSQADVYQFVLRLEQTRLFSRVKLVDTNRYPVGDEEAVAFRLHCQVEDQTGKDS
ncbi:MAG: PilN domain-containing protein [Phycisphaerae bacterium]|nr:PilN domain-containing protein [Phycisphaerae bacterium]